MYVKKKARLWYWLPR